MPTHSTCTASTSPVPPFAIFEDCWTQTARKDEYSTVVADGISVLIAKADSRDPDDQGPDYVLTVKDKNDVEIFSIRNGEQVCRKYFLYK